MKVIFGLGNPGQQYANTRHNAGFMVLDEYLHQTRPDRRFNFSSKFSCELYQENDLVLAKPQTYMNDSGKAVQALIRFYKIEDMHDVYVVHDDLDIELGSYKMQFGTGPKVHNGLSSIYRVLGTEQFWHVRVGVDSRHGDRSLPGYVYVMQPLSQDEKSQLQSSIFKIVPQLDQQLSHG